MIGILMLNTRFPRLPGDIGNAESFQSEVLYQTVEVASVSNIVVDGKPDNEVVDAFVDSAMTLIERGASVIGTSCGFMASVQQEISNRLPVPFLSSSLILLPMLRALYGQHAHIGVLTFDSTTLGACHFPDPALFDDASISVSGLPSSSHWYRCIAEDRDNADIKQAKNDVLNLVTRCLEDNPKTTVLLLECTNLSPWKDDIKRQSGLPVFDLVEALVWIRKAIF